MMHLTIAHFIGKVQYVVLHNLTCIFCIVDYVSVSSGLSFMGGASRMQGAAAPPHALALAPSCSARRNFDGD